MRLRNPKPIDPGPKAFNCPRHDSRMTLADRHVLEDSVGVGIWHCQTGKGYWWEDGREWFRLTVTP
jgi:hypothetical protein